MSEFLNEIKRIAAERDAQKVKEKEMAQQKAEIAKKSLEEGYLQIKSRIEKFLQPVLELKREGIKTKTQFFQRTSYPDNGWYVDYGANPEVTFYYVIEMEIPITSGLFAKRKKFSFTFKVCEPFPQENEPLVLAGYDYHFAKSFVTSDPETMLGYVKKKIKERISKE